MSFFYVCQLNYFIANINPQQLMTFLLCDEFFFGMVKKSLSIKKGDTRVRIAQSGIAFLLKAYNVTCKKGHAGKDFHFILRNSFFTLKLYFRFVLLDSALSSEMGVYERYFPSIFFKTLTLSSSYLVCVK